MLKLLIFFHLTFLLFCGSVSTFAKSNTTKINNARIHCDQIKSNEKNKTLQIEAIDVDFYEDLHAEQDENFLLKSFADGANCNAKWYNAFAASTIIVDQQILYRPKTIFLQSANLLYLHQNVFRI